MLNMDLQPHSSAYLGTEVFPQNKLSLSDTELFFELDVAGDRTPVQHVIITNIASLVQIKKVILVSGSEDFILDDSNSYPLPVNKGESFHISVDFKARVDGMAVGMIAIYTNEDHLPYTINLKSRIQRVPLYPDFDAAISSFAKELLAEKTARIKNDNLEIGARTTLGVILQAADQLEAATRKQNDDDILAKLAALQAAISGTNLLYAEDQQARAWILEERGVRLTADSAEAWYRLQLEADFNTAVSQANARIDEELYTRSTAYDALASRTLTIETNYQTAGSVNAIAAALVKNEEYARTSAISAEAYERDQIIASLRTETGVGLSKEVINRNAAIANESAARISVDAVRVSQISDVTARFSSARGITPNSTFEAGLSGWNTNMTLKPDVTGRNTPTSEPGGVGYLISSQFLVDTSRAYQVNCSFRTFNEPTSMNVGLDCFGVGGVFLARIFVMRAGGQLFSGSNTVNGAITGETNYPPMSFISGVKFPTGTISAKLNATVNYLSSATGYGQISSFWLDDITNAYAADARITTETEALTTALGSTTKRIETQEANYTGYVQPNISFLLGENITRKMDLIQSNASIKTEQDARANAVLAEARRVDSLLANYTTTGVTTAQITAAVSSEAYARADAIKAEASRVDNLFSNFSTVTGPNLVPNNDFRQGLENWQWAYNAAVVTNGWGTHAESYNIPAGAYALYVTPSFKVNPNQNYIAQADLLNLSPNSNSGLYINLVVFRSDGSVTLDSQGSLLVKQQDFSTNRAPTVTPVITMPADAYTAVMRVVHTGDATQYAGVRNVKVEQGNKATSYSADASDVDASAKVITLQKTTANNIAAEASRVDGLLVNYTTTGAVNSIVNAAVNSEAGARTSAIGAEARRVDGLLANYSNTGSMNSAITAAVKSEADARADAVGGVASLVNNLSIALGTIKAPNLIANGSFINGLDGWYRSSSSWNVVNQYIPVFVQSAEVGASMSYTINGIIGGQPYCFGFESDNDGGNNSCHICLRWYNSSGQQLGYDMNTRDAGSGNGWGNRITAGPYTAPAGVASASITLYNTGGDSGNRRYSRIQLQQSNSPTDYTESSGVSGLQASVTALQYATADILNNRVSAFWSQGVTAGNNHVEISAHASSNGGASIDIVGPVTFKGALDVQSSSGSGHMAINSNELSIYDNNNVRRVRLGI